MCAGDDRRYKSRNSLGLMEREKKKTASQGDDVEQQEVLQQEVRMLEVACTELRSLPESRNVYLKHGALFFRTDVKSAANWQQKKLDKAKAGLK